MDITLAIAQFLKIDSSSIKSYEIWDKIYFVKLFAGRAKFVSKSEIEKQVVIKLQPEPLIWSLKVGRRQFKAWVAKLAELEQQYTFKRNFIEGKVTEWSRKGAIAMEFLITSPGIYHDSDGDYFEIDEKLEFVRYMCKEEAKSILQETLLNCSKIC